MSPIPISSNETRLWILVLGILSLGLGTSSAYSESDDTLPFPPVEFKDSPHPPKVHHHHIHHQHHQTHDHNGRRDNSNGNDNGNHHFHYHQHFQGLHYQNHHQNHPQEQTTETQDSVGIDGGGFGIEQQQSQQPDHSEEHLHQDSPYYGGYSSSNKYSHNHVTCQLPESWRGKWFQSGTQNVLIDTKSIEGKGTCYESSADKFLFVEKGNCHRCVVINQKHPNVLEYKETPFCEEKNSLDTLCSQIPGDAMLYSLFRIDAQPIMCPFKGPYTFTYNKGSGACKNPISHVDTCTEPSRLLLRYQACPDVLKSESTVEELQCLAQWRDTSYNYLVGKLNYQLAVSNEDRYRCFIYETVKGNTIVKIAVSGDATCNGLSSPIEGAKTLTFTKVNEGGIKCKFPHWISSHHWHSLDGKLSVKTNHKNSTMHIVDTSPQDPSTSTYGHHHHTNPGRGIYNFGTVPFGNQDSHFLFSGGTRITCQSYVELSDEHLAVVAQHTEGCTSTTVCMHFYKRHSHVIELQMRKQSSGYYDDYECGKAEAVGPNLPYVTLIRAEANSHRCPYLGKYMAAGVSQDGRLVAGGDLCISGSGAGGSNTNSNPSYSSGSGIQNLQQAQHGAFHSVVVGCGQRATMDFHSKCLTQEPITSYECHGSWEENGTGFLIASPLSRSSTSARRFCFTYMETDEGLQFFSSSESCRRDVSPNVEGIWAFNLTVDGQCAEPMTGGGARSTHCDVSYILVTLLVLLTFCLSSECELRSVSVNVSKTFSLRSKVYSLFAKISSSSRGISSRSSLTSEPSQSQKYRYQYHSSRRMVLA